MEQGRNMIGDVSSRRQSSPLERSRSLFQDQGGWYRSEEIDRLCLYALFPDTGKNQICANCSSAVDRTL